MATTLFPVIALQIIRPAQVPRLLPEKRAEVVVKERGHGKGIDVGTAVPARGGWFRVLAAMAGFASLALAAGFAS